MDNSKLPSLKYGLRRMSAILTMNRSYPSRKTPAPPRSIIFSLKPLLPSPSERLSMSDKAITHNSTHP
ncbi:hypothetical protein B9Q09_05055 [Candidatus Marsarchaeota G2 archaeon ECH_B_SAG-C16]|uniref:Uncharacterized protein n=1 Tax=Candidatus Marsarchaeota G2 archaeon ECH_B_SAG-C16 TaxID=1978163 RepID=A0A2R6B5L8_9ARCH|nr:MAG: hypothetical protein B9Q09_05055 [Candidatus Marsarchaeota G2 archaeon ECH_B_SAG-C16]